ncbi:SAM-dependent methyltransferase [Heliobacterium gestii]|uniref:SAM-dependent methyltransferase n=1 Tax=Heliomicrobium gestii TaxID=2699 RepID=A0A845LAM7_HELGE|nr:SAM-dependent methyltransferase [Heliomicrobium gestii]MBM7865314.1 SAM-dependent MidA family methyltransferase [Heliomicrobium gestii]MZP41575.1 SAM-dependent methyltransferase [Heliomicrobium gestii]
MPLPLEQEIRTRIRATGPIPFRDYMEVALYHPQHGYYTAGDPPMGRGGDFITAPEISPFFGRVIGRQLTEMWEQMDRPDRFDIIEFGPGRGLLARAVLDALAASPLAGCLIYHLVEISSNLRAHQREALAGLPLAVYTDPSKATPGSYGWSAADTLPTGLTGVVFSNEFLDALPVHRLVIKDGRPWELYVAESEKRDRPFCWHYGPLSDPRLNDWIAGHIKGQGVPLEEGQVFEINLAAADWLQTIDHRLERAFVLTIDYGHPVERLYSPERQAGTLICYRRHQADADPLEDAGEKDMTAHVDFTSLQTIASALGWNNLGLTNQMWFLIHWLRPDDMRTGPSMTAEDFRRHQAMKKLLMPGGMGEIFKVLIQSKGLPPLPLTGLNGPSR